MAEDKYLAPGQVPDTTRPDAYLDPKLAEIRDEEIKANDVSIEPAPEPTIDAALVKARDEEIKRLGGQPIEADANVVTVDNAGEEPAPKKASAKKSSK